MITYLCSYIVVPLSLNLYSRHYMQVPIFLHSEALRSEQPVHLNWSSYFGSTGAQDNRREAAGTEWNKSTTTHLVQNKQANKHTSSSS